MPDYKKPTRTLSRSVHVSPTCPQRRPSFAPYLCHPLNRPLRVARLRVRDFGMRRPIDLHDTSRLIIVPENIRVPPALAPNRFKKMVGVQVVPVCRIGGKCNQAITIYDERLHVRRWREVRRCIGALEAYEEIEENRASRPSPRASRNCLFPSVLRDQRRM